MAEALAGLSIAANVMAVISLTLQTISIYKKISEGGSPVEEAAADVHSLSTAVKDLQQDLDSGRTSTTSDEELRIIALKVLEVSEETKTQLDKYQNQQSASKLKKFAKAWKYQIFWTKYVQELEARLHKLQQTMEIRILVNLRKQIEDNHIDIHANFDQLDHRLKSFVTKLQAGHQDLETLFRNESTAFQKQLIDQSHEAQNNLARESAHIRHHVSTEAQVTRREMQRSQAQDTIRAREKRLLESLYFKEMNARSNQVADAHQETFGWIFEDVQDGQSKATKSDLEKVGFTEWLQDDMPIFWIRGKPGSGKSTLMRFLIHDIRTQKILDQHRPGTVIVSAFIWLSGSHMQRSIKGLLCALLHDLITQLPSVLQNVPNEHFMWNKVTLSDWSVRDLEDSLFKLVKTPSERLLIFIDGLDEIDPGHQDGQENLWKLLNHLGTFQQVKLCVSSRPEPILERRLRIFPHLKLEDLTRRDIQQYVFSRLDTDDMNDWMRDQIEMRGFSITESSVRSPSLAELVHRIAICANGVFLWVCLVTHAIHHCIISYDDWDALLEQIESLPPELGQLYENLWKRQKYISNEHRLRAAEYLNVVLDHKDHQPPVLTMLFNTDSEICKLILRGGRFVTTETIIQRCRILHRQVISKCCGLLELHPTDINAPIDIELEDFDLVMELGYVTFQFLHRSARDFLINTTEGQRICGHDRGTLLQRRATKFLAGLTYHVISCNRWYVLPGRILDDFIQKSRRGSPLSGNLFDATLELCETTLNRALQWKSRPYRFLEQTAQKGPFYVAEYFLSKHTPALAAKLAKPYSSILVRAIYGLRWFTKGQRYGLQLIRRLLERGASPNSIVLDISSNGWNHPPFAVIWEVHRDTFQEQSSMKTYRELLQVLIKYGMDTAVKGFFQCMVSEYHVIISHD